MILPCLNEAPALPWLLDRIPAGYRPVVADNGSTDGSARVAAAHGAVVVDVPQRGFGAACHAGLLAASSDIVCVMDADGSFDPRDLGTVADPVRDGHADLMLGRRMPLGSGAWPLHARAANVVLATELRRRVRVPLRDRRFGYPLEMVLRAAAAGWRIGEAPVPYYPRTGKSKVTGTFSGTVRAISAMRRILAECAA